MTESLPLSRRQATLEGLPTWLVLIAVGAVYFAVAKLGLAFAAGNDIVSAVWPPSGVALAAVVLLGYRVWPAIAVAAFLSNVTGDSSPAVAAGIASGNALAAVTAGFLLARAKFDPALRRIRDVVALALLGAGASTALNATIGVACLWADGVVSSGGLWEFWRVWWLGDLTGVLLVAPPLLLIGTRSTPLPRARIAEASLVMAALVGLTILILDQGVTLAYPVFPLLILVAMRFRQPGAAAAALVVSILGVYFTANGEGPFVGGSSAIELLRAQLFVAVAAATALLVAAMRTEWERAEDALAKQRLAEERLEHMALHDPLTGLPNRALFLDRLEHALASARRPQSHLAVFFCDIDGFKHVNDGFGHEAGDELLIALPPLLREALRPADTVARFGGDEFVILCEDLESETDAVTVAERIAAAFAKPLKIEGRVHHVSVSVGVVFAAAEEASASGILRDADAAMYRAKDAGKGRFALFDECMRERLLERLRTEDDLRRAIERREFRLEFQPVVSLASGELVAAETLLRWQHPRRGTLAPGEFIGVAEESGLIVELGTWVIGEACARAAAWNRGASEKPLAVSVNLSARQVADSDLAAVVTTAVARNELDPSLLALEISESVLLEQGDASLENLRRLEELGVALVLDDFGTGYSSFGHLKRIPLKRLKIDRGFIAGLGEREEDEAIAAAILSMAQTLGVAVTAKGIETEAQLRWLQDHGCEFGQGYLLARPLPAEDLLASGDGLGGDPDPRRLFLA
ncbi:MAG TPA: EAL domain-containing protein [Solirubrobacterales bacterium]|nr:EAL domain-containing protein [Solirubrobacterales bacterium]